MQRSSIGVMRSKVVVEHDSVEAEEIKHVMSDKQTVRHDPSSSLSDVSTSSSCPGKKKKESGTGTDSSIEELTLLESKSRCLLIQDDDPIVHLTEPRLESFCVSKC